jgi:L-lysine 2,3-aminomutase
LAVRPGLAIADGETQRLWSLRCHSLFSPDSSGALPDFFAGSAPSVEVRLCAGLASTADWANLADLSAEVRGFAPDAIVRLELWADEGEINLPQAQLTERLRQLRPLFVHFWVRPELQIPGAVRVLWGRLVDSGIPIAGELLLRRGRVPGIDALRELCLTMVELRVRPYGLVDPAWLPAEERLTPLELEALIRGLRGWISGLAVPQWVEEGSNGARTPRIPAYLLNLDDTGADAVSYSGTRHRYQNPPK